MSEDQSPFGVTVNEALDRRTLQCNHDIEAGCMWCCSQCNYARHICPGCGTNIPHGQHCCAECAKL